MGKAARALTLILLLACSAQAGYIQNDKTTSPPPPPQPAGAVYEPTDATVEPTADGYVQNETAGFLTQVALDMLAALPSLF